MAKESTLVKENVKEPKSEMSVGSRTSPNEAVITSSIHFTCDAVVKFENEVKSCPRRIDPYSGKRTQVVPRGVVQGLKEGAQNYYDRAILAETKSEANLNRALLAESKNMTSLYGGLASGLVIGAGVVGIVMYIRKKRREKRQKGNK